jgi:hypothetical protein
MKAAPIGLTCLLWLGGAPVAGAAELKDSAPGPSKELDRLAKEDAKRF